MSRTFIVLFHFPRRARKSTFFFILYFNGDEIIQWIGNDKQRTHDVKYFFDSLSDVCVFWWFGCKMQSARSTIEIKHIFWMKKKHEERKKWNCRLKKWFFFLSLVIVDGIGNIATLFSDRCVVARKRIAVRSRNTNACIVLLRPERMRIA